jgi:hypothetical protein
MSLDVYLKLKKAEFYKKLGIDPSKQVIDLTDEEIDALSERRHMRGIYSRNITHNLNKMAMEAGIYEHLWRPDEIGITEAKDLIVPLKEGLARLRADPERFKKLNPANGWGDYPGLIRFVECYVDACERYPGALVEVSR